MERAASVEEKIKRAEEIYARRHSMEGKNISSYKIEEKGKKIKIIKKMGIQIIVSLLIYACFYTIQNSNFVFSEDFINYSKEVLSYDINFEEIYKNIDENIKNNSEKIEEQNIGGSNEEERGK